jgi:type I restriction-modification system DNA methylase subunit
MTNATLESFKSEIRLLVDSFDRDKRAIKADGMNEADLRLQYLDPLFAALGWDVGNRALAPYAMREVLAEPANTSRGASRRPDYLFRVSGIDKFICEAKRPYDHIERHFFQTQNYVYNLRLWFGVLCDFENFIVFLVGAQPSKDRPFPPLNGWRLASWEYLSSAARLWDHFSREAVADGALDRLAHDAAKSYRAGKQGWLIKPERTQRIDNKFLSFLEDHRARLADRLKKSNAVQWTTQSLTEATQKIIDRLLFQRICEDRHIDVGTTLAKILEDWDSKRRLTGQLWPKITQNFLYLKRTFNGGLYGKPGDPAHPVDKLNVPDEWLADFLDTLTADDSPYIFSVIAVEILGSVYERFLASVVLASGKLVLKPEHRKSEGVYYTPKHIVEFIVGRTVGAMIEGKTPREVARVRILDPACGSGSFLLSAFEHLCEYHIAWLLKNPSDRAPRKCYEMSPGDLRLTTGFKREILRRHIFGVDIDPQAVEVTQMSLYLKVLEGETHESLAKDHSLFPTETYLPDLGANVKCGNSLIGTDAAHDFSGPAAEFNTFNCFDWDAEFPQILNRGGFDAVIGNPPYLNVDDTWGQNDYRLRYLKNRYAQIYSDKTDILFYFMYKATLLSKDMIGFIVSRAFLECPSGDFMSHLNRLGGVEINA